MGPQHAVVIISDDDVSVVSVEHHHDFDVMGNNVQNPFTISDDDASFITDVEQSVDIDQPNDDHSAEVDAHAQHSADMDDVTLPLDDIQHNVQQSGQRSPNNESDLQQLANIGPGNQQADTIIDSRYRRRDIETSELRRLIRPMDQPPSVWNPTESTRLPLLFERDSTFFHDENACLKYLWERGIFYTDKPDCPSETCDGRQMNLKISGRRIRWRCFRSKCNTELSIRKDTPFYGKKQQLHKLLLVYRMLLSNEKVMRIKDYTAINADTIAQIKKDFNEMLLCDLASVPSK